MSKIVKKEIKKLSGKAIHKRQMIEDKDHLLVAVSGGKDSISMLWLLKERIKRISRNSVIPEGFILKSLCGIIEIRGGL